MDYINILPELLNYRTNCSQIWKHRIKYTIGYLDYYERCTVVSVWWVLKNCLWFCITKVSLSALLCKCSKNVNFSWKTNKRCYKHDKCLHCKGNFFCKFSWPLASKQICRCIQKMYFCLRPRLKYTTVDVVFVLSKLFLWPFLPKKTTACMQSFYCTLWQKYHFLSFWIFSPKPITRVPRWAKLF